MASRPRPDAPSAPIAETPARRALRAARRFGPLAALAAAWALFFLPQIVSNAVPFYRDLLVTYLPIRHYLHARLSSGDLPQWFPFESLGVPFIGQIVTATFHPQTWLLLAFDPLVALKLNILAAYLLALAGSFLLARILGASRPGATAAALAFGFGGYLVAMSNNLPYLVGMATLPWVGWAAARLADRRRLRDAALLGVVWASIFLAGDAQAFALAALVAIAAASMRRPPLRATGALLALAAAVAALLTCVEFLPALAVSRESLRVQGAVAESLGHYWALHPPRVFELVIPGFVPDAVRPRFVQEVFGATETKSQWAITIFAGAVALLLGAVGGWRRARAAWAWIAVAALGLVLALGAHAGMLPVAWKLLPLVQRFRFPEKYLALFAVGLAPLVAFGYDAVAKDVRRGWKLAAGAAALLALGALAIGPLDLVGALWNWAGHPLGAGALDAALRATVGDAWRRGLLGAAGFLAASAIALGAATRWPRAALALPALLFAELWWGNAPYVPTVDPDLVTASNPFADQVRAEQRPGEPPLRLLSDPPANIPLRATMNDGPRWVEGTRLALRPNVAATFGIATFGNNLPVASMRESVLFGGPGAGLARGFGGLYDGCFRVVDAKLPTRPEDETLQVSQAFGDRLVRQPCLPRAYLAGARPVADMNAAIAAVQAGQATGTQAVWEGGPEIAGGGGGTVRWLRFEPEALELEVEAATRAALIVSEAYAPGWTAEIDGAPAPLYPANAVARGLAVAPGRHRVTMRYSAPDLRVGAALSLIGLAAVAACGIWGTRTRGAAKPSRPAPQKARAGGRSRR